MFRKISQSVLVFSLVSSLVAPAPAIAGRKIASEDVANLTPQMLAEMNLDDLENLAKEREDDLAKAENILQKSEKVVLPEGTFYKVADAPVLIGAIGGGASLVSAILTFKLTSNETKKAAGVAKQRQAVIEKGNLKIQEVRGVYERMVKNLDSYWREHDSVPVTAIPSRYIVQGLEENANRADAAQAAYEIAKKKQAFLEAYRDQSVRYEKVLLARTRNFKTLVGVTAGLAGMTIAGLAGSYIVRKMNTVHLTEEEKIVMDATVNFIRIELAIVRATIKDKKDHS